MPNLYGNFAAKTIQETQINCPQNTWTALPTTPLSNRQYMETQNKGEYKLYFSFDNTASIQQRAAVASGTVRGFAVQDNLTLYGRSGGAGSVRVVVTEYA